MLFSDIAFLILSPAAFPVGPFFPADIAVENGPAVELTGVIALEALRDLIIADVKSRIELFIARALHKGVAESAAPEREVCFPLCKLVFPEAGMGRMLV